MNIFCCMGMNAKQRKGLELPEVLHFTKYPFIKAKLSLSIAKMRKDNIFHLF